MFDQDQKFGAIVQGGNHSRTRGKKFFWRSSYRDEEVSGPGAWARMTIGAAPPPLANPGGEIRYMSRRRRTPAAMLPGVSYTRIEIGDQASTCCAYFPQFPLVVIGHALMMISSQPWSRAMRTIAVRATARVRLRFPRRRRQSVQCTRWARHGLRLLLWRG
jgi:hypothetical protein